MCDLSLVLLSSHGMPPEAVRGPRDIAPGPHPRAGGADGEGGGDELWDALLRWLRDEHGMDVGPRGLLVERRDAEGALCVVL